MTDFVVADAVLHEAGHAVAALAIGKSQVRAKIGTTAAATGAWFLPHYRTPEPEISVAGAAAELLHHYPGVSAEQCQQIVEDSPRRYLSPTDWAGVPADHAGQVAAFARALQLLRINPDLFRWAYCELRDRGEITPKRLRQCIAPRHAWRKIT